MPHILLTVLDVHLHKPNRRKFSAHQNKVTCTSICINLLIKIHTSSSGCMPLIVQKTYNHAKLRVD